jgi:alpha-L-rhamnosidase
MYIISKVKTSMFLYLRISGLFLLICSGFLRAAITPTRLTCEYLHNPMVVDVRNPRLSWINVADNNERGQIQTAFEIRVASSREKLLSGEADLWNSGKTSSQESVNISYSGKYLVSRQDCWWQVRVWDKNDVVSAWSEPGFWSMGLLNPQEWRAQWIGAPWQSEEPLPKPKKRELIQSDIVPSERPLPPPAPMLRKSFRINKEIVSARAYVTGLGFFELYVNGQKVSEDVLVPNLTLYGKRPGLEKNMISLEDNFREYRIMYLCYDIKDLLRRGENVIGAMLGNGFYNSPINWTECYGSPRFIGQIYITYGDGTEQVIISDRSWKAARGPVNMDLIYDGEHYDARKEQPGWCTLGFDDSKWEQVAIRKTPEGKMKAHMSLPDRVKESMAPVKIDHLGNNHYKVDFGQEISGWLHLLDINGDAGQRIEIKYICESPVGANSYTCKGTGHESYAARFTWFVFRELEISNWPGELRPDQLRAEAVYTDIETTGKFDCSNPLFNKINKIWWRSQTDNMHGGIASDCPHRERSPYTGDGQVACVTVMHNFDARPFYTKWIQDILGAQNPETGYVPNGAPWQPGCGGGVAWGAAMNIIPWEFYLHYGDMDMLRNNYEGMKGYIKYMLTWTDKDGIMFSQAPDAAKPNYWLNLGDWVAPDTLPPASMVHTFYLWRCADITAKAAKALNRISEAFEYQMLAERTQQAFQRKFFNEEKGTYGQYGGNIFALKMGVPEEQKPRVLAALKADIIRNEGHLDTGIFGTQFFFEVLADNGLNELAFEAMNKRTQPSYGWWIEQGATTTWEEWNGEGSRNHPMFGGGIVWFYRKLAGMNADPEKPGYRHIVFCPQPAGDITYASYSNLTPNGTAGISWKKDDGIFIMDVTVPVGSTATVYIPAAKAEQVKEGGKPIIDSDDISLAGISKGYVLYSVTSDNT